MAKKAKAKKAPKKGQKKNGEKAKDVKPEAAAPSPEKEETAEQAKPKAKKKANGGNGKLAELKKEVEKAAEERQKVLAQAEELHSKARELEQNAKQEYAKALAPYRDACRQAKVECEFAGGRSAPVAPRVRFLVEQTASGIKIAIKDKPETEEIIPFEVLKKSINKAADAYVTTHVGSRETAGNKAGGLGNRLRALMKHN